MSRVAAVVSFGSLLVACSTRSPDWVIPDDAGSLCTFESSMRVELDEQPLLEANACVSPPLPDWVDPVAACEVFVLPAADNGCFAEDGLTLADPRATASVLGSMTSAGVVPPTGVTVCRVPLRESRADVGASASRAGPWPGCTRGLLADMPLDLVRRGPVKVFFRCSSPCQ